MAKRTGAPIVPVLFDAANSWLFQSVGQLHGMIRTALLPRELLWKRNKTVKVRICAKIDAERLKRFENAEDASEFVRACVYLLADRPGKAVVAKAQDAIAPAADVAELRREVQGLPAERTLARIKDQRVLLVSAEEIPLVLREIEAAGNYVSGGGGRHGAAAGTGPV